MIRQLDLIHMQSAEQAETARRGRDIDRLAADSQRLWFAKILYTDARPAEYWSRILATFIFGSRQVDHRTHHPRRAGGLLRASWACWPMPCGPSGRRSPQFLVGLGSIRLLYKIIADPDVLPYRERGPLALDKGNISMQNVSFGYGDLRVLRDF